MRLFTGWSGGAVRLVVTEPHAMTLATVDRNGEPDARVLILKAVDCAGWPFAGSPVSQKGADLAARPVAAFTSYWPELARQVPVRGHASAGTRTHPGGREPAQLTGTYPGGSAPANSAGVCDRLVLHSRRRRH